MGEILRRLRWLRMTRASVGWDSNPYFVENWSSLLLNKMLKVVSDP